MSLEKFFHLKENHTDAKTEIMAGITSFMTMAYILAVNPNILAAAGMDQRCGIYRDSSGCFYWYTMHGIVRKLSVCTGSGHGIECILCVYRCHLAWDIPGR